MLRYAQVCALWTRARRNGQPQVPSRGVRGEDRPDAQPVTVRCGRCRGSHFAQANVCPKKREARRAAKGVEAPPPPPRQRGVPPPLEDIPLSAPASTRGEVEAGMEDEPAPEEADGMEG